MELNRSLLLRSIVYSFGEIAMFCQPGVSPGRTSIRLRANAELGPSIFVAFNDRQHRGELLPYTEGATLEGIKPELI